MLIRSINEQPSLGPISSIYVNHPSSTEGILPQDFAQRILNLKTTPITTQPQSETINLLNLQPAPSQKEHINHILTQIFSDHLHPAIEFIYCILTDALEDKNMKPQITQHIITLFSSGLLQKLPGQLNQLASIIVNMQPKQNEKYIPIFLKTIKHFIDDIFCNKQLKAILIAFFVEITTPIFLETEPPLEDLSKKQKGMIIGALQGFDEFFKDLIQSMNSQRSSFTTSGYNALHSTAAENQVLEDAIVREMNVSLCKKGLLTLIPHSPETMKKSLFLLTQALLSTLIPDSKEKESLVYISALCFSKSSEAFFSPRMMLYLMTMLLNLETAIGRECQMQPLPIAVSRADSKNPTLMISEKEKALSSPVFSDKDFTQRLDSHFQNLLYHSAHLGTTNTVLYKALMIFLQCILQLNAGKMGKGCAQSIYKTALSTDWTPTLTLLNDFLYQAPQDNKPDPTLKKLYSETHEDIQKKRETIEGALKANIPFEKINALIKNYFQNGSKQTASSAYYWNTFTQQSNALKSLCGNFSNSVYIISQREGLMKMLYCYLAIYMQKELTSQKETGQPSLEELASNIEHIT